MRLADEAMGVDDIALQEGKGCVDSGESIEGLEIDEFGLHVRGWDATDFVALVVGSGDLDLVGALDSPARVDELLDEDKFVGITRLEADHVGVSEEGGGVGDLEAEEVEVGGSEVMLCGVVGGGGAASGGFVAGAELAVLAAGSLASGDRCFRVLHVIPERDLT